MGRRVGGQNARKSGIWHKRRTIQAEIGVFCRIHFQWSKKIFTLFGVDHSIVPHMDLPLYGGDSFESKSSYAKGNGLLGTGRKGAGWGNSCPGRSRRASGAKQPHQKWSMTKDYKRDHGKVCWMSRQNSSLSHQVFAIVLRNTDRITRLIWFVCFHILRCSFALNLLVVTSGGARGYILWSFGGGVWGWA